MIAKYLSLIFNILLHMSIYIAKEKVKFYKKNISLVILKLNKNRNFFTSDNFYYHVSSSITKNN